MSMESFGAAARQVQTLAAELESESFVDLRARVGALGELDAEAAPVAASAVAVVAVRRLLGVDLHAGQVMAGLALASGWTVQMRTGEGKTFAAIAPALLHATVTGPVHVVTANAYLAERDAGWSGRVLEELGVGVGVTLPGRSREATRRAYAEPVTFGAAVDFAFDFLRDRLYLPGDAAVQRERSVAIIDEVDSVLLDNARTPLVLSGPAPANTEAVVAAEQAVRQLGIGVDVAVDEEHRRVELTEAGVARCEELLGLDNLYRPEAIDWLYLLNNALRARALLTRDHDYVVAGGQVEVVDETTGRIVDGRRWSDGLHQAVEAREGVTPSPDREPVARITAGGYFAGYGLVVGMSGTLEGAEAELAAIHGMDTVAIPTHRPVIRVDHPDVAFAGRDEKFAAVADDTAVRHRRRQPVLVGTRSIADTHAFGDLLAERGVPHRRLTAQDDAREAAIIADAGRPTAVTVATQMAGRGVDIVLGGAASTAEDQAEVLAAGGLMVWGLEHHPAHRLDQQLRGRSGRQGDPGESRFAVSDDDEIAAIGQPNAESLDAQLRADVRRYDTTIDTLERHVAVWRARAAHDDDIAPLLAEAVAADARHNTPSRRRRKARAEATNQRLAARRVDLGGATFEDAARILIRTLLVALWPQTLDELEAAKSLARMAPAFGLGGSRHYDAAAVTAYRRFETATHTEWISQLLAFRLSDTPPRSDAEGDTAGIATSSPTAEPADVEDELQLIDWTGWSYNRFWRERLGIRLPEPPVVLVIDAIGDPPQHAGLTLHLDLDDPSRTVIQTPPEHPNAPHTR